LTSAGMNSTGSALMALSYSKSDTHSFLSIHLFLFLLIPIYTIP
jgi:hypothetical protein